MEETSDREPIVTAKCDGHAVLFLDIDGTLGPDKRVPLAGFERWPETVKSINAIIEVCDARIVVCSARIGKDDDEAIERWFVEWLASTWRLSGRTAAPMWSQRSGMTGKEAAILGWLEDAEANGIRPARFAVFDDEMLRRPHWCVAGRWVVAKGPLDHHSTRWRLLWALLGGLGVMAERDAARSRDNEGASPEGQER